MNLINLSLPALALSISLSFLPSGTKDLPSPYWESGNTYVYYTAESAEYLGVEGGTAYFETGDGNVWTVYAYDPDLHPGDPVTLTFENRESRIDYLRAEEYGIESATRIDNGRIISID